MVMHPDHGLFLDIGSNSLTEINFNPNQYAVPDVDALAADFNVGLEEGWLPFTGKDQQSFWEPFNEKFGISFYEEDEEEILRHSPVTNSDTYTIPKAQPLGQPLWKPSMPSLPQTSRDLVPLHSYQMHGDDYIKIEPVNGSLPNMGAFQTSPSSLYSRDNSFSVSIGSSERAKSDYAGFFCGNNNFGSLFSSVTSTESVSGSLPVETTDRKRKSDEFEADQCSQPQWFPTVPLTRNLQVTLCEQGETKKMKKKKSNVRFQCPHCNASFKVKSYLTRHVKKHSSSKAFNCPFYGKFLEGSLGSIKCHSTGGFSRRDTYKTHLKALHFIYPPGTKSTERNFTAGRCAGCLGYFEDNNKWLLNHIEKGRCPATD